MPELIYSGFVGSWGYYNSSGTFVKTTSSGAPLSQPLPVSQSVVPSVWQPSQLAKQQQDFQKRVNDPRKPRSPEEARELYGTMQQDVYVLPGAPIGTEITKTTKTLGRQESYEEYAKEIAAGGGVYRGERQEDKPDILEIGAVVASDISRSFTGIGATEYTSAFETKYPRVETFGLSEKTQQWEERGQAKYSNVLESPQYKTTKVVGMLGFLSGGGGFAMADWGSEAIFIGNTMATGGKSRTAGTLRVSQEGFLGTRVTDYPVKFTQKGFKQGSSFFVEGYGSIGDNLITSRGFSGSQKWLEGDLSLGIGAGEIYGAEGQLSGFRYLAKGRTFDDLTVAASRTSEGNIMGFTKKIGESGAEFWSKSAGETLTAAGEAMAGAGQQTKMSTANIIKPILPSTKATGKGKTRSRSWSKTSIGLSTATGTSQSTKTEQRMLTENIVRVADMTKVSQRSASKVDQSQIMGISLMVDQGQTQREERISAFDSMQMVAQDEKMDEKVIMNTDTFIGGQTIIPPPIPGLPRWPMQMKASGGGWRPRSPRKKPRRKTKYTPSLAAWAGNITGKVSRKERKAMFTGYEFRPIPLDNIPKKKKVRKGRRRK